MHSDFDQRPANTPRSGSAWFLTVLFCAVLLWRGECFPEVSGNCNGIASGHHFPNEVRRPPTPSNNGMCSCSMPCAKEARMPEILAAWHSHELGSAPTQLLCWCLGPGRRRGISDQAGQPAKRGPQPGMWLNPSPHSRGLRSGAPARGTSVVARQDGRLPDVSDFMRLCAGKSHDRIKWRSDTASIAPIPRSSKLPDWL
jgi:hypothetical protein